MAETVQFLLGMAGVMLVVMLVFIVSFTLAPATQVIGEELAERVKDWFYDRRNRGAKDE